MTGIPDPAILSEVALFRDLHSEQLSKLAARLHQRTLPSGANVITAEERGDSVYVILEGTAKVYVTHTDGTEVILAILGPGEIVGEMSAADSLGRSAKYLQAGFEPPPLRRVAERVVRLPSTPQPSRRSAWA
jgi:CRP/FNR family transcriptional regulator, cyclic AMP receptor protein